MANRKTFTTNNGFGWGRERIIIVNYDFKNNNNFKNDSSSFYVFESCIK